MAIATTIGQANGRSVGVLLASAAAAVLLVAPPADVAPASAKLAGFGPSHTGRPMPFGTPVFNSRESSAKTGGPCRAEMSATLNVQVNCRAEDGSSRQNTQSETSVAARGRTVVVGYNDTTLLVGKVRGVGIGYSVSADGGRHFRDMGGLPTRSRDGRVVALPYADPVVAAGDDGFYATALAFDANGALGHSKIAFYRMARGKHRFELVSTLADVGRLLAGYQADKEWLAVARRSPHAPRFFVTWSYFTPGGDLPVMLSDSVDGRHWRTTRISGPHACDSGSQPVRDGRFLYVAWSRQRDCSENLNAGSEIVARVDIRTATVLSRSRVAAIHGAGDRTRTCAQPGGSAVWEVIETRPGHDARLTAAPSMAVDHRGVLYLTWNDRPAGVGGPPSNATRVYLSFSVNGHRWSSPRVISGALSRHSPRDRFQPSIAADSTGLHATWYERVRHRPVDLVRADREDLTLLRGGRAPIGGGERKLTSAAFPIVQTNPQQDPSGIPDCYMGDYNGVATFDGVVYAAWGDNRNVVSTTNGREHEPDVFFWRWRAAEEEVGSL